MLQRPCKQPLSLVSMYKVNTIKDAHTLTGRKGSQTQASYLLHKLFRVQTQSNNAR